MKTKVMLSALFIALMSVSSAFANNETKIFKVLGNCGMCEKRIEKAATSVKGVSSAEWDKKTKLVTVVYDSQSVNLKTVQQAIAKSGHDTGTVKAKDAVYNALPGCCKYERVVDKKE